MRTIMILALSMGFYSLSFTPLVLSQDDSSNVDSRAFPAPWRPSFGQTTDSSDQKTTDNAGPNNLADADITALDSLGSNPSSSTPETQTSATSVQSEQTNSPPAINSLSGGVAKVTRTMDMLPNAAGQIWREYDISPYTVCP